MASNTVNTVDTNTKVDSVNIVNTEVKTKESVKEVVKKIMDYEAEVLRKRVNIDIRFNLRKHGIEVRDYEPIDELKRKYALMGGDFQSDIEKYIKAYGKKFRILVPFERIALNQLKSKIATGNELTRIEKDFLEMYYALASV